jgi:hypothetical protein
MMRRVSVSKLQPVHSAKVWRRPVAAEPVEDKKAKRKTSGSPAAKK